MSIFHYSICNQANEDIFKKQCSAIVKHIKGLCKMELLTDVDGSATQKYFLNKDEIIVHNSEYLNEVYIDSTIDLNPYFIS